METENRWGRILFGGDKKYPKTGGVDGCTTLDILKPI